MTSPKTYPRLTPEFCCTNLDASLNFYTNVLGFSVDYARPEDGFAMLHYQGADLMLEQLHVEDGRRWVTGPMEYPFGRGINFQIQTDDVNELYNRVVSAKIPLYADIEEKWYRVDNQYTGNKQFCIQDPDGYLLRFYQDMGMKDDLTV